MRNDYFPQYKANRPPTPEEIVKAFSQVKELLSIRSIKQMQIEKQEADDVIGSLVKLLSSQKNDIVIASGDKDLAQLVSPQVCLTNIKKGEIETYDEQGIKEKIGVYPHQVADYLALMGDAVDNIPGVKGVGMKTAAKLINDYQNIQGVIENIAHIKGKIGKAIAEEKTFLQLYLKLTQIDRQIPLPISSQTLDLMRYTANAEREKETQFYKKMGFVSELIKLEKNQQKAEEKNNPTQSKTANLLHQNEVDEWLECIAQQIETQDQRLFFIQNKTHTAAFFSISKKIITIEKKQLKSLPEETVSKKISEKITQKIYAYNWKSLWYESNIKPISTQMVDLMLLFYLLYAGKASATWKSASKEIAKKQKKTVTISEDFSSATLRDTLEQYTFLLSTFQQTIEADAELKSLYEKIEKPLEEILVSMEKKGVFIEKEKLQQVDRVLGQQISNSTARIYALSKEPFNIDSPKQVGDVLYHKMKLPVLQKTPTGIPSTNEESLQKLSLEGYEIASEIIIYRGLSKLQTTYTKGLLKHITTNSRIHTKLNQTVTATGRLSSSEPNLQNIPIRTANGKLIRQAFCAPKGRVLIAADYSQIELRILAHQSEDEHLIDAFQKGLDIHRVSAAKIFRRTEEEISPEQRRSAKTINFGLIYGMSSFSLSKQLNISLQEAKNWTEEYFEQFPKIQSYMEKIKKEAHKQEWVKTLMGRKIHIPDINSRNYKIRSYAERAAINAPIQGAAADIIKKSMVKIFENIKEAEDISLVLQIHDELLFEVEENRAPFYEEKIRTEMQNVVSLSVPLDVEIGIAKNWDEAH